MPSALGAEFKPEKAALSNGLPVIYLKDDSSPLTVLKVLIKAGKDAQPKGLEGLAFLVDRLTLEIPDQDKVQDLMNQSSRTGLIVREDFGMISVHCLSANFEDTVEIISGIMRDPLFSGMRIDRIKSFMRHLGEREQDDARNVGHQKQLEAIFGPSGYGSSTFGDAASLKGIWS
jgi:predicted Zn-dependent peptidase